MTYIDGWTRVFTGIPEMNKSVKDMLHAYRDMGAYGKIMLFFTEKCEFDEEYSEFLLRELIEGNI